MILVLADDFSGATEIGGVGHRYGLKTEIQFDINFESETDMIVVDTATRSLSESEAVKKMECLASKLTSYQQPLKIFKKVDSVLRGHISAEAGALLKNLNFKRIILLPANPGRGRKIVKGHYEINGRELYETVFAHDPDFPRTSSSVAEMINGNKPPLPHIHINSVDQLPSASFITGDITSSTDLKRYIAQTTTEDLCCGGAEFFEAFLEHQGYSPKKISTNFSSDVLLIINGSTVRNIEEEIWFKNYCIHRHPLPGKWEGEKFILKQKEEKKWQTEILDSLRQENIAAVSINHTVKSTKNAPGIFSTYFVNLIHYITQLLDAGHFHLALTGGATASGIISGLGMKKLTVEKEIEPGVVTVISENKLLHLTVKPGSYPWPAAMIEKKT